MAPSWPCAVEARLGIADRLAAGVTDPRSAGRAVHGGQQLRPFNADEDEYGFQPIVVFDGEGRPVAALLRPARRPTGQAVCGFLRRLVREIRSHWPRVEILLRADSHSCAPAGLDFGRAERVDFILAVASTTTLRRHVETLERSTAAQQVATAGPDKRRGYKEFFDGAASWSRVERIIARVEAWKIKVMIHLPSAYPDQAILRLVLERLPRLVV